MTLEQYRNLSEVERQEALLLLKQTEFEVPVLDRKEFSIDMLSVDWYYRQRFKEREKKPEISWPSKLSKKEEVVCKLTMMQTILEASHRTSLTEDNMRYTMSLISFIKSSIKEVYRHKSSLDGPKFGGIPEDVAQVINAFYPNLMKSFRKNFVV